MAAAVSPIYGFPVVTVVANPDNAPTNIIPSTPRLTIPERSETIPPSEANSRGAAAGTAASSNSARNPVLLMPALLIVRC
jgi:hypothetical protein